MLFLPPIICLVALVVHGSTCKQQLTLTCRSLRNLGVQIELVDVDSLVSGQCSIPGSGFQSKPAQILEFSFSQVLSQLSSSFMKFLSQRGLALVQRSLSILVLNGDQSSPLHQIFSNGWEVPKCGIMKGSVAMLIHKVDISFVLQEL